MRRARLHAVVAATGIASVAPLAFGAAFPPVFPLAKLYPTNGGDGTQGFVLTGINSGDYVGLAVSAAGDVNADGIDDFIIGAHYGDPRGADQAGESYVVFGSSQGFPAAFSLASLYPAGGGDGSKGFVLIGIDPDDHSGHSVSAAGDINGDGIDDLIIGAKGADPNGELVAGESYVVFGSTQAFPAVFPLASLYPAGGGDGSRGFVLAGNRLDLSGWAVSAAGDVNGDGVDDLVIGAPGANPAGQDGAGVSYVVFGSTQGFAAVFPLASLYPAGGGDGSRGFVLAGHFGGSYGGEGSGSAVSGAGDINGDGIDDLVIGAYLSEEDYDGRAYVVFGSREKFPAVFPLAALYPSAPGGDGSRGFVLTGIERLDEVGYSVSGAGDVNGDGIDDLIIGSRGAPSYVILGSTQGFPAAFPLARLYPAGGGDGSRGFVLQGGRGTSVSAAGDVNDDGIADLIVGDPGADAHGVENAGATYLVFGSTQAFPPVFPLAILLPGKGGDGSRGVVLPGTGGESGSAVSDAGDVNADGIDDVIIGAWLASPGKQQYAGASYVVFGRSAAP